jgi:hypothetical protein
MRTTAADIGDHMFARMTFSVAAAVVKWGRLHSVGNIGFPGLLAAQDR